MVTHPHVLVTGGAGFIGSHLTDLLLGDPEQRVTVLDRLSIGGSRANLEGHAGNDRLRLVVGDVNDVALVHELVAGVDAVVHAAAESHVDRSIDDPRPFFESNVLGTQVVLEACRRTDTRLLMVSTDEVYGPGEPGGGLFDEEAPLRPRSPYATSKAAADLLCATYASTYGADVTIVRGTNAFGPRQIERVVPTFSIRALEGSSVPVYGQGKQRREFLHVDDWVRGALIALERGEPGVVYNIGAGTELENIDLAERICALAGVDRSAIEFVPDRLGHDFRYGMYSDRLLALGWQPRVGFDEGLATTVDWYRDHLAWIRAAHEAEVVTLPREPEPVGPGLPGPGAPAPA